MITIIVLQLQVEYNINQMKNILKLVSMLIFSTKLSFQIILMCPPYHFPMANWPCLTGRLQLHFYRPPDHLKLHFFNQKVK